MCEREYWYWLSKQKGIAPVRKRELIDYFGNPKEIFMASKENLERSPIAAYQEKGKIIKSLLESRQPERIREEFMALEQKEIQFVSCNEDAYPQKLRELYDFPCGLFVKGNLPKEDQISIAVVGARNCSAYGRGIALQFAEMLARAGVQIVSGMARGIDGYAHTGCLEAGEKTFGILGSGVDVCYPRENLALYTQIEKRGGIISEFLPGEKPLAFHFPMRNRIISGLSDGVLVIEARKKSGSLITVDQALEQGKDVFAVPGRIGDQLSEGCNHLIKQGAVLVTEPADILNFYGEKIKFQYKERKKINNVLDSKQKIVYASLSLMPKHLDEILNDTGLVMTEVIRILTQLELQGDIKQVTKNCYMRNK